MESARVGAVNVLASPFLNAARFLIRDWLLRTRLPGIFPFPENAEEGGLLGYGPRLSLSFLHMARYADKILRGARPADLPIEQPTQFELVINLRTAKALVITVPQSLLLRGDKVIE